MFQFQAYNLLLKSKSCECEEVNELMSTDYRDKIKKRIKYLFIGVNK